MSESTCGKAAAFIRAFEIRILATVGPSPTSSRSFGPNASAEAGGDTSGIRIYRNTSINEQFITTHQGNDLRIENNTARTSSSSGLLVWIGVGGAFGNGSTSGFVFRNNILESRGMIWQVMKALDPTAIIDNNLYFNAGAYFGEWAGQGLSTVSSWQSFTGRDRSSRYGDPRFVNPTGGDFHLLPDSTAIDRGAVVAGVTDGYVGVAPDMGRFEYGGTE